MFTWEFSNQKGHSPTWYLVGLIVVLFFVVYGIVNGIYILSIAVFLFAGTYILIENNTTPVTPVKIESDHIIVESSRHEMRDFESFSILLVRDKPVLLRLFPKKRFGVTLDIPITPDVPVHDLKEFLALRLEENTSAEFTGTDAFVHLTRL